MMANNYGYKVVNLPSSISPNVSIISSSFDIIAHNNHND